MPHWITHHWPIKFAIILLVIAIVLIIIFWPRKTTPGGNSGFTCPAPGTWVDCMPRVIGNKADQNAIDYCNFVQKNCPDAQIAL